MRRLYLLLLLVLTLAPGQAQMLTVTGEFRVVDVDPKEQRIGVARVEDDPKLRQNWIYIKQDTVVIQRQQLKDGKFKDEVITPEGQWKAFQGHIGKVLRVHGGRDWDGSIDAKNIWM